MAISATNPSTFGEYGDVIREFHRIDKRNQAVRTKRAIVVGILLTVLGGAAVTGCGSTIARSAPEDAPIGDVL